MPFVVRSQGFWFTDEYNAPVGHMLTLVRRTYESREEAEDVLERLHRDWLRAEPDMLRDQLWETPPEVVEALTQLLQRLFPDDVPDRWNLTVPHDATDDELDEIIRVGRITLAEVHEIDDGEPLPDDDPEMDDINYGDPELYEVLNQYDPAPWPPAAPTPGELDDSDADVQVAWDWVASHAGPEPVARSEARRRARELGLSWHEPVHRALVSFAPDTDQLRALLPAAPG